MAKTLYLYESEGRRHELLDVFPGVERLMVCDDGQSAILLDPDNACMALVRFKPGQRLIDHPMFISMGVLSGGLGQVQKDISLCNRP